MVMKDNVLKAIKENLPAASAEAMKEYFAAHEKLQEDFKNLESENKSLDSLWKQESEKVRTLNSYKDRLEEIEEKEKAIAIAENEIDIRTRVLAVREEFADIRVADHKEMFNTVFRNTTVRTEVLKNATVKTSGYTHMNGDGSSTAVPGGEILEPDNEHQKTTEE